MGFTNLLRTRTCTHTHSSVWILKGSSHAFSHSSLCTQAKQSACLESCTAFLTTFALVFFCHRRANTEHVYVHGLRSYSAKVDLAVCQRCSQNIRACSVCRPSTHLDVWSLHVSAGFFCFAAFVFNLHSRAVIYGYCTSVRSGSRFSTRVLFSRLRLLGMWLLRWCCHQIAFNDARHCEFGR